MEIQQEYTNYFRSDITIGDIITDNSTNEQYRILDIHNYLFKLYFNDNNMIIRIENITENTNIDDIIFGLIRQYGAPKYNLASHQLITSKSTKFFDTSCIGWFAINESDENYIRIGDNYLSTICQLSSDHQHVKIYITLFKNFEVKYYFLNSHNQGLINGIQLPDIIDEDEVFNNIDFSNEFIFKRIINN